MRLNARRRLDEPRADRLGFRARGFGLGLQFLLPFEARADFFLQFFEFARLRGFGKERQGRRRGQRRRKKQPGERPMQGLTH
jgi:hypothetical protein